MAQRSFTMIRKGVACPIASRVPAGNVPTKEE
jgi:hypothetical protein